MKTKRHIALYLFTLIWDLTICWPVVLLVWLFWGTDLRWSAPPQDGKSLHSGYGLWCDLKPNSWPTRSWYRQKRDGEYQEVPEGPLRVKYGKWDTWGGTTLGHGGFFGPARRRDDMWMDIEEHENTHVEQFEAMMVLSFIVGAVVTIVQPGAWILGLVIWWLGYVLLGVSAAFTAWMRGENPYRGNFYEEAAYAVQALFKEGRKP